jgi:DNA-binding LacI/PurR family transcriptional regulator/DNA-binding transcriptional regulator YhcF (GntR family)
VIDRNRSVPVSVQICNHLRKKVLSGEWQQGSRIPNGLELSRQFGVAYQTLVRSLEVLKNEGLLVGIPSQGTFVRSNTLKLTNVAITFDPQALQCLSNFEFQRGAASVLGDEAACLQTFILPGGRIFCKDNPTTISKLLLDRQVHGVIVTSANLEDVKRLVTMGIPTVTSRAIFPNAGAPWVIEDVAGAMRQVAELLVDKLGHRRIGLVMGARRGITDDWIRPTGLMDHYLSKQLTERGIKYDTVYSELEWEKAEPDLRVWLSGKRRPTALFFASNEMAAQGIDLARGLGLSVPGDVSIVSMSYGPTGEMTTIHTPTYDLGAAAIGLLRKAASGQPGTPVELPTRVNRGDTIALPRSNG